MELPIAKWYTRLIGIFFVLVAVTLIADYLKFGIRLETWHKLLHVFLGLFVLYYGWNNSKFWMPFSLANGIFFTFAAFFGIVFPDFLGLDAFNRTDTILHGIVGSTGIIAGFSEKYSL